MKSSRTCRGWFFPKLAWVAGLLSLSGCCYSGGPFIREPLPEYQLISQEIPQENKGQVAIFFIQDGDILDCDGFRELNAQVRACGYRQTYFGFLHHAGHFAEEIKALHEKNPTIKIVLAGHGLGAAGAKHVLEQVSPIPVDLVFLCDSPEWLIEKNRCENASKLLAVPEFHVQKVGHVGDCEDCPKYARVKKHQTSTEEGSLLLTELGLLASQGQGGKVKAAPSQAEKEEWDFLELAPAPKEKVNLLEAKPVFEKKAK
ncbi:MAG: hypothetical protein EXR99_02980 [Gemmataceae bacterium]|nr:hypothetical protein [Gemmataceae bacterium]